MFTDIICATDLSPRSDEALRLAVLLAAGNNARLTVLNVHEEFMDKDEMVMLRVSVEEMQERFREIAIAAKARMAEAVTAVGVDDLKVEYLLREGKPGEGIIKATKEIHEKTGSADILVVMGTNGKHSLKEYLLGSVAEYIVHNCPYPVMVVPHPKD
ncbi:MAG: universal stress protein [Candidatus Marinimicrobia bacterium]|nr:universal stress protein [Candidatus Neomarinimicrobiota bacterium]